MRNETSRRWAGVRAMVLMAAVSGLLGGCSSMESGRVGQGADLSRGGWRLVLDTEAPWRDDKLYLPDEVKLEELPVNAPTGGWGKLSGTAGIPVSLPGTVEEYYFTQKLAKDATPNQKVNINGSYTGVWWWYRNFTAPTLATGERCVIHFRGTRLRAEVYVNQKLVGYNIITEAPFDVDVMSALRNGGGGGDNQLAVRITNPGGELAWNDTATIRWGGYLLPMSHGFGGIDGGVEVRVRGPVHVSELTVLNTPEPATVSVSAEVTSTGGVFWTEALAAGRAAGGLRVGLAVPDGRGGIGRDAAVGAQHGGGGGVQQVAQPADRVWGGGDSGGEGAGSGVEFAGVDECGGEPGGRVSGVSSGDGKAVVV